MRVARLRSAHGPTPLGRPTGKGWAPPSDPWRPLGTQSTFASPCARWPRGGWGVSSVSGRRLRLRLASNRTINPDLHDLLLAAGHHAPLAPLAATDLPRAPHVPEGAPRRREAACRGQTTHQHGARNPIRTLPSGSRFRSTSYKPSSAEVAGTAQRSIVAFPCLGGCQWIVSSQGRTLATCAAGYFPNSNRARGRPSRGFWSRKKTNW